MANDNLTKSLIARQVSQTPDLGGRVSKNAGDAVDPQDLVTLRQLQDAIKTTPTIQQFFNSIGGGGGTTGSDFLLPQAFGAKGDGVTDDTSGVQQAINASATTGKSVLINQTFIVKSLSLPGGCSIFGQPNGILRWEANSSVFNVPWITNPHHTGLVADSGYFIQGVTFDGNSANQGAIANFSDGRDILQFINAANIKIINCIFLNAVRSAITGCKLNNIEIASNLFQSWLAGNAAAVVLDASSSAYSSTGGGSVSLAGGTISNVRVHDNFLNGVPTVSSCLNFVGDPTFQMINLSVENNTCLMPQTTTAILGIQLYSPNLIGFTDFTIGGNLIDGSSLAILQCNVFGISVAGAGGVRGSITGNVIKHCGGPGIEIVSSFVTCTGNTLYDSGAIICDSYGYNDRIGVVISSNIITDPARSFSYPATPRVAINIACGTQDGSNNAYSVYDSTIADNNITCSVDTLFVGILIENQNTKPITSIYKGTLTRIKISNNTIRGNGTAGGTGLVITVDGGSTGNIDQITADNNAFDLLAAGINAMGAGETNGRYLFNRFGQGIITNYINQPTGSNMVIDITGQGIDTIFQTLAIRSTNTETLDALGNIIIPLALAALNNNMPGNVNAGVTGPNLFALNGVAFGGGASPSPYSGSFWSVNSKFAGYPNWTQFGNSSYTNAMFLWLAAARFAISFGAAANAGGNSPGTLAFIVEGDTFAGGIGTKGVYSGLAYPIFPQGTGGTGAGIYSGNGSPVGVVTAGCGSIYLDYTGGKLWVQATSGSNNTGWAVGTSGITALTGDVTATGPGSSAATLALPAWTAFSPGTTNLTSVTTTLARGQQKGKTAFVRIKLVGTSNGSTPTIGIPYTNFDAFECFAVAVLDQTAGNYLPAVCTIGGTGVVQIILTGGTAYINAHVYQFWIQGSYETT